jgi:hypothetical protein
MARHKRLLTLSLTHLPSGRTTTAPETYSVVTTDISLTGAFLSLSQETLPPRGSHIVVESIQGLSKLRIEAFVVRTVQRPSFLQRVRGIGVAFTQIEVADGLVGMERWLSCLADTPNSDMELMRVQELPNGIARYIPRVTARLLPLAVHTARISPARAVPDELSTYTETIDAPKRSRDRRRFSRTACSIDTRWLVGDLPHAGLMLNASRSGVFIHTDHKLPAIGQIVTASFATSNAEDTRNVVLEGRVRRHWMPSVEGLPGFGLRIERMQEHGRSGSYWMFLRRIGGRAGGPRRGYRYNPRRR